jgi:plasmid stabilization system protein ParE
VPTDFHPAATAELEESIEWYAAQSPSAARAFCVAMELALASIAANPERFAFVDERHRACNLQRFPFQIIFHHREDHIRVLAVAHARRRPGYWQDRN